ncbi:MAG: hypothetical protein R3Y11_00020 [Pseudomonadota bacterium]
MNLTNDGAGTWFSNAGTLGTVGLVGALICALLAIMFLIKQYKGQAKASTMTRLFLILALIFLLVARFAPQENMVLSEMHGTTAQNMGQSMAQSMEQSLEHEAEALLSKAQEEMNHAASFIEDGLDSLVHEDNLELQSLEDDFEAEINQSEAELNEGLHGGIEAETDQAINEIDSAFDDLLTPYMASGPYMTSGAGSVEGEAVASMDMYALNAAKSVDGVHAAQWNASMLPDLQLDVVADVTPESAIPLMNTLCTTLSDNTTQPVTVSVKDLEGGHIARQMCGVLTQGVD